LPGWLVVVSRRHVVALDELSVEETAGLGPLLRSLTSALRTVTGCAKTYVALFAEAEGYAHVHFHVVPRMADFTGDQRGPKSLHAFLGAQGAEAVPEEEMDRIATALRRQLR
jgi:diadenosine tetraphosphate (Ap4A) HIT family hydrolase